MNSNHTAAELVHTHDELVDGASQGDNLKKHMDLSQSSGLVLLQVPAMKLVIAANFPHTSTQAAS
jgi:hypothetical protein